MSTNPPPPPPRTFPILGALLLGGLLLFSAIIRLRGTAPSPEVNATATAYQTLWAMVTLILGIILLVSAMAMALTESTGAFRLARNAGNVVFVVLFVRVALDLYLLAVKLLFNHMDAGVPGDVGRMMILFGLGVFVVLWNQSLTDFLKRRRG